MLNGQSQGGEYDEVKWIIFSPDSQRLAFFGRQGKNWSAVLDGRRQELSYKEARGLVFSMNGQHHAHAAKKGDKWLVVKNGVEGAAYDAVDNPRFSPRSQRLVYAAKRRDAWVIVEEGKEGAREFKDGYDVAGFTPYGENLISIGYESKTDAAPRR
jgi:hypothetical protein